MNPEQAREQVRLALTSLAHDARQALSPEQYEEALEQAENTVMNYLYDCYRNPAPEVGQQPRHGTWSYQTRTGLGGHYRLVDAEGHLVAVVAQDRHKHWQGYIGPDLVPIDDSWIEDDFH